MTVQPEIHVVSYNIHKGFSSGNRRFTLPAMRQALESLQPDLVCLQEVQGQQSPRKRLPAGWLEKSQVDYLSTNTLPYAAYGANAARHSGHHGNGVLSRFPIRSTANIDLSLHGWERRGLLHVVIELPHSQLPLHVLSTHLNLRARDRKEQLKLIGDYLEAEVNSSHPLILAGDFNDWRRHAPKHLPEDLSEVFSELSGMAARSYPGWWPMLTLDRIYTRNLRPVSADCLFEDPWLGLSDHHPLSARLTVPAVARSAPTSGQSVPGEFLASEPHGPDRLRFASR